MCDNLRHGMSGIVLLSTLGHFVARNSGICYISCSSWWRHGANNTDGSLASGWCFQLQPQVAIVPINPMKLFNIFHPLHTVLLSKGPFKILFKKCISDCSLDPKNAELTAKSLSLTLEIIPLMEIPLRSKRSIAERPKRSRVGHGAFDVGCYRE